MKRENKLLMTLFPCQNYPGDITAMLIHIHGGRNNNVFLIPIALFPTLNNQRRTSLRLMDGCWIEANKMPR